MHLSGIEGIGRYHLYRMCLCATRAYEIQSIASRVFRRRMAELREGCLYYALLFKMVVQDMSLCLPCSQACSWSTYSYTKDALAFASASTYTACRRHRTSSEYSCRRPCVIGEAPYSCESRASSCRFNLCFVYSFGRERLSTFLPYSFLTASYHQPPLSLSPSLLVFDSTIYLQFCNLSTASSTCRTSLYLLQILR